MSFSCYVSVGSEVITSGIIEALLGLGKLVYVPIITSETEMTFLLYDRETELLAKDFRVTGSSRQLRQIIPEVSIIPVVAASQNGTRIGYGRGYYDRWLKKNGQTQRIGLAFNCQLNEDIFPEEHDQKLDKIITETNVICCTNHSG